MLFLGQLKIFNCPARAPFAFSLVSVMYTSRSSTLTSTSSTIVCSIYTIVDLYTCLVCDLSVGVCTNNKNNSLAKRYGDVQNYNGWLQGKQTLLLFRSLSLSLINRAMHTSILYRSHHKHYRKWREPWVPGQLKTTSSLRTMTVTCLWWLPVDSEQSSQPGYEHNITYASLFSSRCTCVDCSIFPSLFQPIYYIKPLAVFKEEKASPRRTHTLHSQTLIKADDFSPCLLWESFHRLRISIVK